MPKSRPVPKIRTVTPAPSAPAPQRRYRLVDSPAITSPWAWRAFFMMTLVALGFCINFAVQHYSLFYSAGWGLITAVWFSFSMFLWRQHTRWVNMEI
jgi:uncharacterized membrane protein